MKAYSYTPSREKCFIRQKIRSGGLFGFGLAINTTVNLVFAGACKLENMREFLLGGGYATGIFAFDDIFKLFGEGNFFLLDKLVVA